ncbi:MAG: glycosyltransferase family 2 protein [Planctomycetaceae bacterium]|jgi:glycosyltransferase involved in cell wall biosynthesis|nr:glycosyltransferase family 2 protein [Planctomycetaceae bacterium]MBT6157739.1 glycosyltransferase family 2 protein [Planctomycetaceae bacterium]MBT6484868.1 glycosyltransferase family 2 protein [Planctomycetaceae bacterium]MBT6497660.1 glycosyltransferase family 2 protein [Planctomycetaceae bacterium]
MPDVSVVLPVFNGARTIARAVRSVLDQTLREIELIVVDDGSTDETAAVVRDIGDPRLRLIECKHRGVAVATNFATELAVAPIIARMDADDFSHPERLQRQLQLLHKQNFDVVGCQVRILNELSSISLSMNRYERWINEETIDGEQISALRFVEFPLVNPTILARRRYFEMGFYDGGFPEDYELMLRAAAVGMRFGKVKEILFDWADHPGRLTRTDSRYTLDAFMRCRQSHLLAGPLRDVRCVDLWGVGETGKPWLRWLQTQNIAVRCGYDINKRKVNNQIHGVPISHPTEMPAADGTPLIIAVGAENARALIRPQILSRGYRSGVDAWFVA